MPHPLETCAFTSVVGVSLHPHGIAWNNARVNIVFLLAINARDRPFFKDIFDFITEIISDEHNLKVILEAKTFDRFIDILVSFAK
jgi:lichenan operon transcriptional antiterminator